MWLVGVVVRRYIDILTIIIIFPTPLVLALFWQHHPYFFVHFKNVFFGLVYVIFLQYISKCYSKNIRDRSKKSRSREYNHLIIYIIKNVEHVSTRARARVP